MIALTLAEVAAAVDGTLVGAHPDAVITGSVISDSRAIEAGSLFVAIKGERVDGLEFAAEAVRAGAVAVLTERAIAGVPSIVVTAGIPGSLGVEQPAVVALAKLANSVRARLTNTTVIALTGSSGKTSTKDLLAHVLRQHRPTVAAVGSRNNEVGFPLTVLEATPSTRFLVLEMGAREIGHIKELCEIARPDIAVVLNVGLAHVGVFGDADSVARAKAEIVEALPASGVAILNADDGRTRTMSALTSARVVLFGEAPDAAVHASNVSIDELARASFTIESAGVTAPVTLQVHGEHQVSNALAAAAAALAVGITLPDIAAALSTATSASPMRMDVSLTPDGAVLIDDAYNANPSSMRAALKALIAMGHGRRTFAVLGEMLELGDFSVREHDEIGRLAVRLNISQVVAVGPGARVLHLGAANEGSWNQESIWVATPQDAIDYLRSAVTPGDVVLVKASRGIGLEVICDALRRPGFTTAVVATRDTELPENAGDDPESAAPMTDDNSTGERGAPA